MVHTLSMQALSCTGRLHQVTNGFSSARLCFLMTLSCQHLPLYAYLTCKSSVTSSATEHHHEIAKLHKSGAQHVCPMSRADMYVAPASTLHA